MNYILDQHRPVMDSPWGRIQDAAQLDTGIWRVSTARHGGIWLDQERRSQLPTSMKKTNFLKSSTWWEEDCDAVKVINFFGIDLSEEEKDAESINFCRCGKLWKNCDC